MKSRPLLIITALLWSVCLINAAQAQACPPGYYRSASGNCLPLMGAPTKSRPPLKSFDKYLYYRRSPSAGYLRYPRYRRRPSAASGTHSVLDTGYKALTKLGGEEDGYGLYSYVIAPGHTERNGELLRTILKQVAPVENTGPDKSKINILYIPVKLEKHEEFDKLTTTVFGKNAESVREEAISVYDQSIALDLLHRICASATGEISDLCMSDISEGPFLFTYASPVTALDTVPPPYLIVDLRSVHERAFPVFVSKFMEQVKRPDFADGERINSFKLSLLSIALTAADWIKPVEKAVAGIVHSTGDEAKDGK